MSAPGLEMGLRILEYVGEKGRAGFTELVRELGINKASLSRFLGVLTDRGYLVKGEGGYVPGESMGVLSAPRPWDSLIHPLLLTLSHELKCSLLWTEFVRGEIHFMDRVVHEHGVSMQEPGRSSTAYLVNPAGYVLLGCEPRENRVRLMAAARYSDIQKARMPEPDWVESRLIRLGREGFFDDREAIYPGIRRAALPLMRPPGRLVGALVLGMVASTVDDGAVRDKLTAARELLGEWDFAIDV